MLNNPKCRSKHIVMRAISDKPCPCTRTFSSRYVRSLQRKLAWRVSVIAVAYPGFVVHLRCPDCVSICKSTQKMGNNLPSQEAKNVLAVERVLTIQKLISLQNVRFLR
jgi:hypothetical protein